MPKALKGVAPLDVNMQAKRGRGETGLVSSDSPLFLLSHVIAS